ncbi:hypothetical protein BH780_gp175 [Bacillus phage Eldridge]|uniref:Uncharacterized protein n=1 Tax=Bacillus phage Eldridge TaxID=1776293 RepID=A0A120HUQ0_9CAUD|nr:hypothetical protein BH780_gp175 [Bacillus phage Eldridge]AMB18758.1 hypothetical protein Eldridge_0178 [Bacillus phage Eldridge]
MEPITDFEFVKLVILVDKLTDTLDDAMGVVQEQAQRIVSLEDRVSKLEEEN